MAVGRRSISCSARYTTPMPPSPSFSPSVYWPRRRARATLLRRRNVTNESRNDRKTASVAQRNAYAAACPRETVGGLLLAYIASARIGAGAADIAEIHAVRQGA